MKEFVVLETPGGTIILYVEDANCFTRGKEYLNRREAIDLYWKLHDVVGNEPRPKPKQVNSFKPVKRIEIHDD